MHKTNNLISELRKLQTKDEILAEVSTRCHEALDVLELPRTLDNLNLFIVNYNAASNELLSSPYYTESCKNIILEPPVILVNAAFLLDLEAAFRSFDLSESLLNSQYLRSDKDLFGLVKRIQNDPIAYLTRLRRLDKQENRRDSSYIIQTLTMVTLFFISHEIGHLLDRVNERSYTTFLKPDAELEQRVANAVVKLCHHADEFSKYGFGLPGGQKAVEESSEIREQERELAKQIETLKTNHLKWFGDEVSADEQGINILKNYLSRLTKHSPFLANQYRYVAVKGIFVAALYTWYRDLLMFGQKMRMNGVTSSEMLGMRMMQERKTYIQAASLFGNVHRFTLLRAVLAIEVIIRSGSDYFDRQDDGKTIWWNREHTVQKSSKNDTRNRLHQFR